MKKKKIAVILDDFFHSGGTRVITNIANTWKENGYDPEIICLHQSKPYFPTTCKITYIQGNNILIRYKNGMKYLSNHFAEYLFIFANFNRTVYPVFGACLRNKNFEKGVYYIQAYEPEFFNGSILKKTLAYFSYKLPLKHIVNAPLYFNYKGCHATRFVPPGLDLKMYYPKQMEFFNNTLKIGCIGRTEQWKGTQDVCDAVKVLKNKGYKVDFYIAFNDNNTVEHTFLKPDGDENLSSFYRNMDIVVAPGTLQLGAIHYPVIESMAVGSTIITTDYYPADDNNSYRVPCHSPEKIAEAIQEIDQNRQEAIRRRYKALEDVQQFSWDKVAKKFMDYALEDQ